MIHIRKEFMLVIALTMLATVGFVFLNAFGDKKKIVILKDGRQFETTNYYSTKGGMLEVKKIDGEWISFPVSDVKEIVSVNK